MLHRRTALDENINHRENEVWHRLDGCRERFCKMSMYLITVQVNHFIEAETADDSLCQAKAWAEAMNERTLEMPSSRVLSPKFYKPLYDGQTIQVMGVSDASTEFERRISRPFMHGRRYPPSAILRNPSMQLLYDSLYESVYVQ